MTNLACSKSWTDVTINFKNRKLGNCCKSQYYSLPDDYTSDFFDNSIHVQTRRQETLNGIQNKDCISCWKEINKGKSSFMDWMNEWDNFDNVKIDKPQIKAIEVELDNTCDLSCLYCSPEFSSKIAQEEGEPVTITTRQKDVDNFKQWLKNTINNAEQEISISFLGGEPTASKLFYELLDYIVTLDTSKIQLEVVTNCNSKPYLLQKFLNAIDRSQCELDIHISNESFKDSSELIRYGLEWERFEQNLHTYATNKTISHINFDMSVNIVALPTFPQYVNWVYDTLSKYDKTFSFFATFVSWPSSLDIAILPKSFQKYIDQTIQIVKEKDNINCKQTDSFLKYLNELKSRIGSDYQENYKTIVKDFLIKKQEYKKTDQLMNLLDIDGLS